MMYRETRRLPNTSADAIKIIVVGIAMPINDRLTITKAAKHVQEGNRESIFRKLEASLIKKAYKIKNSAMKQKNKRLIIKNTGVAVSTPAVKHPKVEVNKMKLHVNQYSFNGIFEKNHATINNPRAAVTLNPSINQKNKVLAMTTLETRGNTAITTIDIMHRNEIVVNKARNIFMLMSFLL